MGIHSWVPKVGTTPICRRIGTLERLPSTIVDAAKMNLLLNLIDIYALF